MTEQVLQLEKAQGFLRKISINVLNKNADYTLFTLPIEGIPLSEQQLDAFMGKYTFRSWYEQRPDNSWHPMPWWSKRDNADFQVDGRFECETAVLTIEGRDFTFEQYSADEEGEDGEEGDDMRPGARISSLVLKPTPGGVTLLSFHLQVRPEIGKVSNALLEHMFRHIAVTFEQATLANNKGKQQSLPLSQPSGDSQVTSDSNAQEPAGAEAVNAESSAGDTEADLAKFEEGARARAEEFKRRAGGTIDGTTMRSRRRRGSDDATH